MQIDWLTDLVPDDDATVSVVIDATRESEQGTQTVQTRWRDLRRGLEGVSAATLDHLDEAVKVPTHVAGKHGRVLVATPDGIVVDRVLAAPPVADTATIGTCVTALARVADETVRYLVAEIDRTGADLTLQSNVAFDYSANEQHASQVEGSHDEIHKVRRAGEASRRLQARAEDSWERNAEVVAEELDRIVARRSPEVLLLTGDVRAVSLVRERLGGAAGPIASVVEGGSRAAGINADAFQRNVADALTAVRARRREDVADRFRQEEGRDGTACRGIQDVVQALRRGQVAELLLSEDAAASPSSLAQHAMWVGPTAMQLAIAPAELTGLGITEPREERADLALGRAAAEQRAGVTILDPAAVDLPDGVGALLRWRDDSTPGQSVYSLSSDEGRT